VTRDQVRYAKPDPDLFLAGAARLNIDIHNSIVVGDSVWDLLAARRAGALGVGLLSGGYGQEELERAGAYRVYEDPRDLLIHLDRVGVRRYPYEPPPSLGRTMAIACADVLLAAVELLAEGLVAAAALVSADLLKLRLDRVLLAGADQFDELCCRVGQVPRPILETAPLRPDLGLRAGGGGHTILHPGAGRE